MIKKQSAIGENKQISLPGRTVLWRGIRGRCPNCGEGKLFESYLKQVDNCSNCQENIGHFKADDGPAWLTILVIGHIVAPFIIFFALNETLPQWLLMGILLFVIITLVFLLLPRSKGLFIAALWLIKQK